jgi:hypothetical protein
MPKMTGPEFDAWYTKHRKGNTITEFGSLSKEDRREARERLKIEMKVEKDFAEEMEERSVQKPTSAWYSSFSHTPDAKVKDILEKKLSDGHEYINEPMAGLSLSVEYLDKQKAKIKKTAERLDVKEGILDKDGYHTEHSPNTYEVRFYMGGTTARKEVNEKSLAFINAITGWGFTTEEMKQFLWHYDGNNPKWTSHSSREAKFLKDDLRMWRNYAPNDLMVPPIFTFNFSTARSAKRFTIEQEKLIQTESFRKFGHGGFIDYRDTVYALEEI